MLYKRQDRLRTNALPWLCLRCSAEIWCHPAEFQRELTHTQWVLWCAPLLLIWPLVSTPSWSEPTVGPTIQNKCSEKIVDPNKDVNVTLTCILPVDIGLLQKSNKLSQTSMSTLLCQTFYICVYHIQNIYNYLGLHIYIIRLIILCNHLLHVHEQP